MSRLWLAALGAAAVVACGDGGGDPNQLFPDVAGVYAIEGEFDSGDVTFTGTVTIEQESLESSLLTGTADITVGGTGGFTLNDAELLDASVDLAGVVVFTLEDGGLSWEFTGEKAGDLLEGDHTLTSGSETATGTWSGER